jgi:hypothetical protein
MFLREQGLCVLSRLIFVIPAKAETHFPAWFNAGN